MSLTNSNGFPLNSRQWLWWWQDGDDDDDLVWWADLYDNDDSDNEAGWPDCIEDPSIGIGSPCLPYLECRINTVKKNQGVEFSKDSLHIYWFTSLCEVGMPSNYCHGHFQKQT